MICKNLAVATVGITLCWTAVGAAPATAAIFNFSYFLPELQYRGGVTTVNGQLITDSFNPDTSSYGIIGITGTITSGGFGGVTSRIDGSLLQPNTFDGNDNLLLVRNNQLQLDSKGFAFGIGGPPPAGAGQVINVSQDSNGNYAQTVIERNGAIFSRAPQFTEAAPVFRHNFIEVTTEPFNPATNSYLITSINPQSSSNGIQVGRLLPQNSFGGNDNLILESDGELRLSNNGFAVQGAVPINIHPDRSRTDYSSAVVSAKIDFSVAAVPEPSSAIGILGMSVLGVIMKLKQKPQS